MLKILFETQDIKPELLHDDRMNDFWLYWLENAHRLDGFNAIAKKDISPEFFTGYAEYITLVDVLDDGADFRYRVYGTGVARHFGRDMTGRLVSDLPPISARFQLYFYQQVYRLRRPVYMVTEGHPNIPVRQWTRLCLPVTTDNRTIDQLLNLALPTKLSGTPAPYL